MADLDVLESAYLYHELGFSTLPLLVGDKKPGIPSWKIYQDRRPSHSELEQWFGGDRRNIGIICGSVSQGLMVRDFDTENSYESWRESNPQTAKHAPTSKTSRGFHIFVRTNGPTKTRRLGDGELRGDGAYVVAPPSIHPTGVSYIWMIPPDSDIPHIDLTELIETPGVTQAIVEGKTPSSMACVTDDGRDSENPTDFMISRAIRITQPSTIGQRNDCLFDFAQQLKGITALYDADLSVLYPLVVRWHRQALSRIGTKQFSETWSDFVRAWNNVEFPVGIMLKRLAAQADESKVIPSVKGREKRRAAALCRELQLFHGEHPFYLDCRNAGRLLGLHYRKAHRLLTALCDDGVLRKISVGSMRTRKANEYQYLGP